MAIIARQHDMNIESNKYYAPQNLHQILHMYDKSKKSWSQRLKITKSEKTSPTSPNSPLQIVPTYHDYATVEYTQSALARSMKYAEPWIYGTVRNMPVPPLPHPSIHTIFAPYPPDVAVVLCSCPEYLNGTKRDVKKASVCKKCRGSRLPLAPIGGTVRLRPTTALNHQNIRPCAGTVRIIPTSMQKARPSILDLQNDPYDLMRRSRLIPAEIKQQQALNSTSKRAKSISPSRGRSRNRVREREKDLWLEKLDPDPGSRKSILQCKFNPYDLISHKTLNHMNEFSPNGEELFGHNHNYMNVKIAGQRVITSPGSAVQKSTPPASICPPPPSATVNTEPMKKEQKEVEQPKRPPRRKSNENALQLQTQPINHHQVLPPSPESEQKQCIKSILKRPSGVSSPLPSPTKPTATVAVTPSSTNDNDVKMDSSLQFIKGNNSGSGSNIIMNGSGNNRKSPAMVRVQTTNDSGSQFYIPLPSSLSTPLPKGALPTTRTGSKPLSTPSPTSSSSSSNLPIFQARKKVQFMVEDKIIQDKDKNDDYEVEDNENDVDDNKDNNGSRSSSFSSFSVYDDVATTYYSGGSNITRNTTPTTTTTPGDSYKTTTGDYDLMWSDDNKNHKGNGNGSINNCCNLSNKSYNNKNNGECNSDTDDITLPFKHGNGKPAVNSNKKQQQQHHHRQRATSKGSHDADVGKDDDGFDVEPTTTSTAAEDASAVDTAAAADDKTKSKVPGGKKTSSAIRRTFSERNTTTTNHGSLSIKKGNSVALLNFNDTMALRLKPPPRSDSRDLFRPKDPPPPPPVSTNQVQQGTNLVQQGSTDDTKTNKGRTVVRVAPFNKSSSEIHRLKILHTDNNTTSATGSGSVTSSGSTLNPLVDTLSSTKRTSILINGDDCYSTVNVTNDTPIYQSSVVVSPMDSNTVTIKCGSGSKKRTPEEEIIYKNNKINTLLNQKKNSGGKSVIPIGEIKPQGRTLIKLDYEEPKTEAITATNTTTTTTTSTDKDPDVFSHEEELVKILRNPVEAVRRNLVPHICGREKPPSLPISTLVKIEKNSLIGKLLEDPMLHHLAEGLESDVVAKLIESSLKRLKANRCGLDTSGTKDNDDMEKLINQSLHKIKEERLRLESIAANNNPRIIEEQELQSNRESVSSGNSFSSANYEVFDFDINNESDCYQSCSSELTTTGDEDATTTRTKFYQMLVDATLAEIEISASNDTDNDYEHQYESIRMYGDPIYEEISEIPPPLPLSPPPLIDLDLEKKNAKSMFEGASKYDILSYLVDAKERGIVRESLPEEESDTVSDLNSSDEHPTKPIDIERNDSGVGSETSKSSRSKFQPTANTNQQQLPEDDSSNGRNIQIHLCEDCDDPVETQITESGVMFAPLVCRKCGKKRAERKEIITEIVETEEKYGRDLQIILEEFYQPMLVAGLLTQEQLSAIFLNTEELLENNQALAERMRDALDIALEQGDDDLLTVNIGKIFIESTQMLHAFESYCVRQAAASLLLANMEKEKELLRIFLKVSQMENTVLRRMNLNSFLMVPVQRVTKYPLLLARLYKVTPSHLDGRDQLKQSQEKIELHLTHINQEAKDVPTKLWRRISSSSPNRRASCEIDMINIKLRKMAIDTLEWNHDEVRFVLEGKLLLTQPTDGNWKKGRTIKLAPVNALLVTNGKPSPNYKGDKPLSEQQLNFPKHTGIREASLLLVKEKCGRYTLLREPLYLDKCVVCTEADWDDYFEVHEISSKDTFIFKAEDNIRTKQWYKQLQYHSQGMGAWRKRRNALANIMINGMLSRT